MNSLRHFRMSLFRGTWMIWGRSTAFRTSQAWRAAFRDYPEIAVDLVRLSGMNESNQDKDGNPLSNHVLRERAAQVDLVRAAFARAELTEDEIRTVMEAIGNEHVLDADDGQHGTEQPAYS